MLYTVSNTCIYCKYILLQILCLVVPNTSVYILRYIYTLVFGMCVHACMHACMHAVISIAVHAERTQLIIVLLLLRKEKNVSRICND